MDFKKATFRFFILVLCLLLLFVGYITLTINKKPVLTEDFNSHDQSAFVVPNAIVAIADETDQLKNEIEKNIQFTLEEVNQVSTQVSVSNNKTIKNKVIAFQPNGGKQLAEQQMQQNPQFEKQSKDGKTYYQEKDNPNTIYYFPNEQTLVVTESSAIPTLNNTTPEATPTAVLNQSDGMAFSFSKNDPHLDHFIRNLPDQVVNKFQSVSGKLSHNEKSTSFVEIKMENAMYARTLAVMLPSIIQQIKGKINKVNGQFVLNGTNVTLKPNELELLNNSQQYLSITSSKKSVYLLINDHKQSAQLLDVLINVIIGE